MKVDSPYVEKLDVNYDASMNLIVNSSTPGNWKAIAGNQLQALDAAQKRVFITDPYLFPKRADASYEDDLKDLLANLNAAEIIFCANPTSNIFDPQLFQSVATHLQGKGCVLTHNNTLSDCHDRFWYCPETQKAVVFGTSLNGLCKRICRVDELKPDEVTDLAAELQSRRIV